MYLQYNPHLKIQKNKNSPWGRAVLINKKGAIKFLLFILAKSLYKIVQKNTIGFCKINCKLFIK